MPSGLSASQEYTKVITSSRFKKPDNEYRGIEYLHPPNCGLIWTFGKKCNEKHFKRGINVGTKRAIVYRTSVFLSPSLETSIKSKNNTSSTCTNHNNNNLKQELILKKQW